jgi:hypothetical protein
VDTRAISLDKMKICWWGAGHASHLAALATIRSGNQGLFVINLILRLMLGGFFAKSAFVKKTAARDNGGQWGVFPIFVV